MHAYDGSKREGSGTERADQGEHSWNNMEDECSTTAIAHHWLHLSAPQPPQV